MRRENRYLVAKHTDILLYLSISEKKTLDRLFEKIRDGRNRDNRNQLECVIVEKDWPEYEQTWESIERRMDSQSV